MKFSMSPSEAIFGLDLVLCAMGCKMYRSNVIIRILNILFWIHFSLIVYYVIVIKLIFISSDPDLYFTFSITLIHFTQLINHHLLCFKIKHLRKVHNILFQELNYENVKYLNRQCYIMLTIYVVTSIVSSYLYVYFIIPDDKMILIINNFYSFNPTSELSLINHIFVHYLMTFYFSFLRNSWLLISTSIYFHFIDCFNFYHENITKKVCYLIVGKGINHKIFVSFSRKREIMVNQVEKFEREMNFFPFLWFSFNFISMISILVSTVRIKGAGFNTFSVESIYNILNIIFTGVLARKISHLKNKIQLRNEDVLCKLFQEKEISSNYQLFIGFLNLMREKNINFTGWQLFDLDIKVLPEFIGSLVTFSVLFVQLLQLDDTDIVKP